MMLMMMMMVMMIMMMTQKKEDEEEKEKKNETERRYSGCCLLVCLGFFFFFFFFLGGGGVSGWGEVGGEGILTSPWSVSSTHTHVTMCNACINYIHHVSLASWFEGTDQLLTELKSYLFSVYSVTETKDR